MTPFLHTAFGFEVQPLPAEHALQNPPLHTPPAHMVPFALLLPSTHTGLPVEQLMVPFLQAALGFVVHEAPELQAAHAPALHTPVGHVVPFALLLPSMHTALPDAQLMMPLRHAVFGFVVHAAPSLQALHEPALHTPPEHAVPLAFGLPSTQVGVPLPHSTVPLRQAAPGFVVQEAPCVQATHWSRELQT